MKLFKFACLSTLVLFGILFFIELSTQQSQPLSPEDGPATGAKLALDYVSLARSYPNNSIPEQGFAQAFEEVQLLNERAKAKGFVNPEWSPMGPINIGGRTLALAIHPDNPDTMFAGSASGGIWKTTSAGVGLNAWEYVSTGFPVLGVAAIAMDPQNPDVMYIGTGESYGTETLMPGVGPVRTTRGSYGIGILKTEDGGETWKKAWTGR